MKSRKQTARDKRCAEFLALMLELDRRDPAECERMLVLAESRGRVRS